MISLVIPVFNEVESLDRLHEEIVQTARRHNLSIEIIFVDDGSTDGSWTALSALAGRDARVRAVRFRRNFGKAAALSAGFQAAQGDVVVTLDADLQDDPVEIPLFLEALDSGVDVVSGWKRKRFDPWHKVWPSRVFNWLVSWTTGVHLHDHNCGMKCYRAEVVREVCLYGELHRFVPVLAAARGFKSAEIEVCHRPRQFGRSKYGVRRFARGLLDLLTVKFLTGFGQRPQHLLGGLGLVSFTAGCLGLGYLALTWVLRQGGETSFLPLSERPLLAYAVAAMLLGVQLLSVGFLAEMLAAQRGRSEDHFSIAERCDGADRTGDKRRTDEPVVHDLPAAFPALGERRKFARSPDREARA
jgi:glycosyltransferase involved in cell wall biosynthesis